MSSTLYGKAKKAPNNQPLSPRMAAALGITDVINGQSLNRVIPSLELQVDEQEQAFFRDLLIGSCRWYYRLNALCKILLKSPFEDEELVLQGLLIIGLYQLTVQGKAAHAAVHATVEVCEEMGKTYAKPVINACLRRYGREYESLLPPLDDNPVTATSHPKWLVKMLTKAWPEQWQSILAANNERAPICLRVNQRRYSRDQYLELLAQAGITAQAGQHSPDAIYLESSLDVRSLPEFSEGAVSVQDEAAQLAAHLLAPKQGEQILDACAAPGGKSCHLLEQADIDLIAADIDPERLHRIEENFERLQLKAELNCADLAADTLPWQEHQFDAILLDVPCSATGVIRRHPDIRMLRRREDIQALQQTQAQILERCWPLVKPGGRLLYATCSVLPAENDEQISRFVSMHPDAQIVTLASESDTALGMDWGVAQKYGRQLFPTNGSHDGFYYALMQKAEK